jgi:hypothetical protein
MQKLNAADSLKSNKFSILKYEERSIVSWQGARNVHAFDHSIYRTQKEGIASKLHLQFRRYTMMFISRYIFDIDETDIPEFRADTVYHMRLWFVRFTIYSICGFIAT